jgi:hypothetical protein
MAKLSIISANFDRIRIGVEIEVAEEASAGTTFAQVFRSSVNRLNRYYF